MSFWLHVAAAILLVDAYAIFLFLLLVVVRDVQGAEAEATAERDVAGNTGPPDDNQPHHTVKAATALAYGVERLPL